MKYAHFADLHLGAWSQKRMQQISLKTFDLALEDCLENKVEFILFSGDIFNTAVPNLDVLKQVTTRLKMLEQKGINVYVIPGSHDYSASGKTMIDILDVTGVLTNVSKGKVENNKLVLEPVQDKSGAWITGIPGRKGMLDKTYYEHLSHDNLVFNNEHSIFMFHTALTELKPKHLDKMQTYGASFLPKNMSYYAGGHVHHTTIKQVEGYGTMTYPGALFPNNFAEIEKYSYGGYFLVTNGVPEFREIRTVGHTHVEVNCTNKKPEEILEELYKLQTMKGLVTTRLHGQVKGRMSDLSLQKIKSEAQLLFNTAKLSSTQFMPVHSHLDHVHDIEDHLICQHVDDTDFLSKQEQIDLTKQLLITMDTEKKDGEKSYTFNDRIIETVEQHFN